MKYKNELNTLYKDITFFAKGGNAEVFTAIDKLTNEIVVIKKLKDRFRNPRYKDRMNRFLYEISTVEKYECDGIIPILNFSKEELWYSMPKAIPIVEYIESNNSSLKDIVFGIIQISELLSGLHSEGVSHRDIKPANLYFYNERYCLGDFGIADFPENPHDLTVNHAKLGPTFTIAPEMKRSPKTSDGCKADVYSLAKTLWSLIYKNEKSFEGVYNFLDKSHSLHECSLCRNEHIVELEELLTVATNNAPENRPNMVRFKEKLLSWLETLSDFDKSQFSDWNFIGNHIFPMGVPNTAKWNDINDIVKIINIVSLSNAYNHTLFPDGGGLDLLKVEKAGEHGCIYLYFGESPCIVKPKSLTFESFSDNTQWNYLFLELDELQPIFESKNDYEYLVEDIPGHYVSAACANYGVYDYNSGESLPEDYKIVYRYLRGNFLIVFKNGPYNRESTTYDGRHKDYTSDEFRAYICKAIEESSQGIVSPLHIVPKSEVAEDDLVCALNKFMDENIFKFDYSILLKENGIYDSNIKFTVCLRKNTYTSIIAKNGKILCNDKTFKDDSQINKSDIYYFYDRDEAISFVESAKQLVIDECQNNGFNKKDIIIYEYHFDIKPIRNGKPTHLFTKEEIKNVMANADDRYRNRLVIDENGYAKILQNSTNGYLYPVYHESWEAGNNYVGKYSNLETLDEIYLSSLEGWLIYLETGNTMYKDCVFGNKDEKVLIEEIKAFY